MWSVQDHHRSMYVDKFGLTHFAGRLRLSPVRRAFPVVRVCHNRYNLYRNEHQVGPKFKSIIHDD